jgi:hypothetical protein
MLFTTNKKNNYTLSRQIGLITKVALFTNARDETHIKEWASHHLLIGFDIIVIFDHKSVLPLTSVFRNFDKRVQIINVSHMNGAIKLPLMTLAGNISKLLNVDWMLYLDADEFFILNDNRFIGVKQFLNQYPFADSLGINWLMFGSNYLKEEPKGLMFDNYTKSSSKLDIHVKSFVRPQEIDSATNPHYYNIKNRNKMYGVDGKVLEGVPAFNPLNVSFDKIPAYIAHYFVQSEETYRKRKGLIPRDDTGTNRGITDDDIKNIHNQYNEIDNLQPMKYSDAIRQFLNQFNDDV